MIPASPQAPGSPGLGPVSTAREADLRQGFCGSYLALQMSKEEQTSDWARRPLSQRQIRYAALEAEVLLRLCDRFIVPDPGPLFAGLSQS